jgi:hypothetical protein
MNLGRGLRAATSVHRLPFVAVAFAATLALSAPDALAQGAFKAKKKDATFNVLPTLITSVTVADGQLVANGLVGTTPFQAPITLTTPGLGALQVPGECPVLNLSLGPIHLTLLGLNVDTSGICLEITAIQGGGLLGDLLCTIANLLGPGGLQLPDVLAMLTPQQLSTLDSGLTQTLNQAVFIPLMSSDALQAASCSVLSLALGPVDLNLLGLRVQLNDCADPVGPVTVDITATPGGGLLGDLLCSLSGLLNGNPTLRILALLQSIATLLGGLVG